MLKENEYSKEILLSKIKEQDDEIEKLLKINKEKEKEIDKMQIDLTKLWADNLESQKKEQNEEIERLNAEKKSIIESHKNKEDELINENHNLKKQLQELKDKIQQQNPKTKTKTINVLDSDTIKNLEDRKIISQNNQGTIYEVTHTIIEKRRCVLKILNAQSHEKFARFIGEYELLNMLDHPSVLKTYGVFLSDEKNPPSILLERYAKDLEKAISEQSYSKVDLAFWIYQIAEGMKYIHSINIIHRDLKPSNIFITDDGIIKIGDFGISKLIPPDEQVETMTENIGSWFFMAPEIANGQIYDGKVDVFSFGVLMFFILSEGKLPNVPIGQYFQGKKAQIPSTFNLLSKEIIDSCWNFEPKDRPSFECICSKIEKQNYKVLEISDSEINLLEKRISQYKKSIPFF